MHTCLRHGLLNILISLLRPTAQEEKIHFEILLHIESKLKVTKGKGGLWEG